MRSYNIELPRGVIVDVFDLPEDFEEQIIESFKGYTKGTAKDYRYCDKLRYIDCCVRHLNGDKYSSDVVSNLVENRILYEWRENGEIIQKDDLYSVEFMEYCYNKGKEIARVHSHFEIDDHHIYDQIQKVLVKVITIVMNYED